MAIAYANEGKLDRAAQLYREAKSHFEQSGDKNKGRPRLSPTSPIFCSFKVISRRLKRYTRNRWS